LNPPDGVGIFTFAIPRSTNPNSGAKLVTFVGRGGTVEIAVRDGSAAKVLGVGVGVEIRA